MPAPPPATWVAFKSGRGLFRRMTMAGYPQNQPKKVDKTVDYGSVDPTPPAPEVTVPELEARLLDAKLPMFERMRALFSLRAIGTPDALRVIARGLLEPESALLRHEAAFIFGQVQDQATIPWLVDSLKNDPNPMVRHEAAEALGAMGTDNVVAILEHYLVNDPALEVRESCEVALHNVRFLQNPNEFEY